MKNRAIDIPNEINIMGINFKVKIKDNKEFVDSEWGCVKYSICEIWINSGLTLQKRSYTFIHECTHAAFEMLGRQDNANDEGLVNCISAMLTQILNQVNIGDILEPSKGGVSEKLIESLTSSNS
jgi:hypothetical protein